MSEHSCYSLFGIFSKWLKTIKFIPHPNKELDQNVCCRELQQVLLQMVCKLSFCLCKELENLVLFKDSDLKKKS